MFKKTLLAVAILSVSTAAMAFNPVLVNSVNTFYFTNNGCSVLLDGKQLGPYSAGPYPVIGTHTVGIRCGSEAKPTDYSVNFSSGMFTMSYSSPAGYKKYMLSAIVNAGCPYNSSASQGTISVPAAVNDNIAIYVNQNFGPTPKCPN